MTEAAKPGRLPGLSHETTAAKRRRRQATLTYALTGRSSVLLYLAARTGPTVEGSGKGNSYGVLRECVYRPTYMHCLYVCTYVGMYVCMYVLVYVCIYIYYVRMFVFVHVCTCGARGGVVVKALRYKPAGRGSIPDCVTGIFQ
jgi:hypothetical protein